MDIRNKILPIKNLFPDFAAVVESVWKRSDYEIGIVLLGLLLFFSCTNEKEDIPVNPVLEQEMTLTINPEYVLYNFTSDIASPAWELLDEKGVSCGYTSKTGIKGFTCEDGYRYKLKVRKLLNGHLDSSYELIEVLSKESVEINQKNSREVTLDVFPVTLWDMKSGYEMISLRGNVVGTDESFDMAMCEIYGVSPADFSGSKHFNKIRMKASITPTDYPIYEKDFKLIKYKISRRVRLQELVGIEEMDSDSIIYVNTESSGNDSIPSNNGSSYGDFEMQWTDGEKLIAKGILNAPYGLGYFTYSLVPGTDFAKYFVDLIYTESYKDLKIVDALTKGGKIQYSYIGNSAETYYFKVTWDYRLGVSLDGKEYLLRSSIDEGTSMLMFDLKTQQWMGVLYINKVQLYSVVETATGLLREKEMSPPLKIVFNTIRKIDKDK